jgi:hypothetical protein
MRIPLFLAGIVILSGIASGDLLHDNYPGDSYNSAKYMSAEKNTQIADSWVVDDATFASPVELQEIEWIGYRQVKSGSKTLTYSQAEYSIRTRTGTPGAHDFPLIPGAAQGEGSYTSTSLGLFQNETYELYSGKMVLPTPIALDPDEPFWFGVRLIGDASNQFLGRNFLVSAENQIGLDQGFAFNSEGWAGWIAVNTLPNFPQPTDFAFRLHGIVIPEPSSLILMLVAAGLTLARRRD